MVVPGPKEVLRAGDTLAPHWNRGKHPSSSRAPLWNPSSAL